MKTIIIEGPDNCGKSLLIKGLSNYFDNKNIIIRHFNKPPKTDNPLEWQFITFKKEAELLEHISFIEQDEWKYYNNTVIYDRSYLGEYVWGSLYRNIDKNIIKEKILNFENEHIYLSDTYLILLTASPEFLLKNDDGQSLSSSVEQKQNEVNLFNELYDFSQIKHKLKLQVNNKDQFFNQDTILYNVVNFLNKKLW